ncbi:hypothetical protein NHF40_09890 [Maricaulaceae bacterium EIL42A08]|nr:hypothetical protein [Maricaulaceae bacterium EIL42A08]
MTALDRIERALGALGDLLDWAFDQLRPVTPGAVAKAGQRSARTLVRLDRDAAPIPEGALATSLMGEVHRISGDRPRSTRGVVGVLDPAHQYTIITQLSEAAAHAGRSALALRLDQLSPIPPQDVVFAHRRLSPEGEVPVRVEVSIARRSAVDAAKASLASMDPRWRLVGALSSSGRPELEFGRSTSQPLGLGLKVAMVSALLAATLLAWGGRLSEGAVQLQAELGSATRQARGMANGDSRLQDVAQAHQVSQRAPQMAEWLSALSQLADEQPDHFNAVHVEGRTVTLERDGREIARLATEADPERLGAGETGEAAP